MDTAKGKSGQKNRCLSLCSCLVSAPIHMLLSVLYQGRQEALSKLYDPFQQEDKGGGCLAWGKPHRKVSRTTFALQTWGSPSLPLEVRDVSSIHSFSRAVPYNNGPISCTCLTTWLLSPFYQLSSLSLLLLLFSLLCCVKCSSSALSLLPLNCLAPLHPQNDCFRAGARVWRPVLLLQPPSSVRGCCSSSHPMLSLPPLPATRLGDVQSNGQVVAYLNGSEAWLPFMAAASGGHHIGYCCLFPLSLPTRESNSIWFLFKGKSTLSGEKKKWDKKPQPSF